MDESGELGTDDVNEFVKSWLTSRIAEKDSITTKRVYIDINDGNLHDGILFGQIMYWHGSSKETGRPRMKIEKEGHLWIAMQYSDWWDECRIRENTARNCIARMKKRGLIITKSFRFKGLKTLHIRVNFDVLDKKLKEISGLTSEVRPSAADQPGERQQPSAK